MNYSARDIAHYIIDKCTKDDHPISNLQLQKILYFAQGLFYRSHHKLLFQENIYAWQYGPVVPEIYDEFSSNGAAPICELYNNIPLPQDIRDALDPIIEEYRNKSVWELVEESHVRGGPWDRVYSGTGYKPIIPISVIQEYFCKKSGEG